MKGSTYTQRKMVAEFANEFLKIGTSLKDRDDFSYSDLKCWYSKKTDFYIRKYGMVPPAIVELWEEHKLCYEKPTTESLSLQVLNCKPYMKLKKAGHPIGEQIYFLLEFCCVCFMNSPRSGRE